MHCSKYIFSPMGSNQCNPHFLPGDWPSYKSLSFFLLPFKQAYLGEERDGWFNKYVTTGWNDYRSAGHWTLHKNPKYLGPALQSSRPPKTACLCCHWFMGQKTWSKHFSSKTEVFKCLWVKLLTHGENDEIAIICTCALRCATVHHLQSHPNISEHMWSL